MTPAAEAVGPVDIESIKREGLTGRQLRLARRVAQKHDLLTTSDYDAVRLLRQRGIDPFKRSNMLELVVPQAQKASVPATTEGPGRPVPQSLPQTMPKPGLSKAPPACPEEKRSARQNGAIAKSVRSSVILRAAAAARCRSWARVWGPL